MLELEAEPPARRQDSLAWDLEQPLRARGCCTRSLRAAAVERDSAVGRKPLVPAGQ